jgi:hypothetical protein
MKKIRIIHFLIFLLFSGCMQNCEQNEPVPLTELDKLPPPTQEGKRRFGCLVNGEAWVPSSFTYINAYYQEGLLVIGAGVNYKNESLSMVIDDQGIPIDRNTYDLNNPPFQYAKFRKNHCRYREEHLLKGKLNITHLDRERYIVSGTFEFTTVMDGCDTIRVTDGRFDLIYSP